VTIVTEGSVSGGSVSGGSVSGGSVSGESSFAGSVSAAVSRAAEQPGLALGPMRSRVAASVGLTGGRYSLYHLELGTGAGTGAHYHRTFAESFHVLSGTVRFFDGERWFDGGPGDHVVVPEGGIHAFRNDDEAEASMLMMSTPGVRREDYFAELYAVVSEGRELGPEGWVELFARHDQYNV
jgi:mannose-6-phosphate isomerase-like protein (cupin superfamily)